jgi:hypothetical protein
MEQTPDRCWLLEPKEVLHYMESAEAAERLLGTPIALTQPIPHGLMGNLLIAEIYLSDGLAGLKSALGIISTELKARLDSHQEFTVRPDHVGLHF